MKRLLAPTVLAISLASPVSAAPPAPRAVAAEAIATGLEAVAWPTKVQRKEVERLAATLRYEELEWVLETAKQRLGDLRSAFDTSALASAIEERFPDRSEEQKLKIQLVLLQVMMGDIAGALRSYAAVVDRDNRQFTRLIVKKLDGIRKARSTVIRNFARTKPPRAYAGRNPSQAARAQDESAKYTQFVQLSTQIMPELEGSDREAMDALSTGARAFESVWTALHADDDD